MNGIHSRWVIVIWVLCISCGLTPSIWAAAAPANLSDAQVTALEQRVQDLESTRAIKHMQRAYGFYADRGLWAEVADLFAPDGTLELGADGVYVGRDRIRQYLQRLGGAPRGLPWGRLDEHYQLQALIHLSADGQSAQGRWVDFALTGQFGREANWGHAIHENTYVRRNGVWMIQSLHRYTTFLAPFEKGWARLPAAPQQPSAVSREFLPDRAAADSYPTFPTRYVVPFHAGGASVRSAAGGDLPAQSDPRLLAVWRQAQRLQDHDDIENLQALYGYYFDRNLWDQVAGLFTEQGSYEHGQQGVYAGRARIRQALRLLGPDGPQDGWLNQYLQLQPVIDVAEDGLSAQGRWEGLMQLARPGTPGAWGLGVYENEYRKERGAWRIAKLHFYVTAVADYDLMWNRGALPLEGASAVLPPDRPPTEVYRALPGVYLPPFHYVHPVTGLPIRTEPQPADSLLRPQGGKP